MRKPDKKIISIVISVLLMVIFLFTAPFFARTTALSKNEVAYEEPFPSVAHGYILSQQFTPQYDRIECVEIYVNALNCDVTQGAVRVNILDEEFSPVYENNILLSELPGYGRVEAVKDVRLRAGGIYYLTIEAVDTADDGPTFSYYPTGIAASTEESGRILLYAGLPLENSVLRVSFRYSVPIAAPDYAVYCLFLFFVVEKVFGKKAVSAKNFVDHA